MFSLCCRLVIGRDGNKRKTNKFIKTIAIYILPTIIASIVSYNYFSKLLVW